jgi:hypothetical protein
MLIKELMETVRVNSPAKTGRLYQHPEDLVYIEGSNGAARVLNLFDSYNKNSKNLSVKWDGSPTIFWGRDEDGTFVLVGKNNWDKEHQNGKTKTPEDLKSFIMSRGKGEDWRNKFASDMANLWIYFESATPKNFRGYIYGDLLFHPGSQSKLSKASLKFTPNQTQYEISLSTTLGKKLSKASVAVVAHEYLKLFGQSLGSGDPVTDVKMFNTSDIIVLGQTYVSYQVKLDTSKIKSLREFNHKHEEDIDHFLSPIAGLSDLRNIIYRYINQSAKSKNLLNIDNNFFNWLETSDVSQNKQQKIKSLSQQHPTALPAIFYLINGIMHIKNDLISQLDNSDQDIKASTNGQVGGEGYVSFSDQIKLVPRDRWVPYRSM